MRRTTVVNKLEQAGIRATPQRVEVGLVVLARPQHLSVDDVIERLHRKQRRISRATVYNCLNLFEKKGLVKRLSLDHERCVYDSATHPHHHFYNLDTGELTDIEGDDIRLAKLPVLPQGTEADSVAIVVNIRQR